MPTARELYEQKLREREAEESRRIRLENERRAIEQAQRQRDQQREEAERSRKETKRKEEERKALERYGVLSELQDINKSLHGRLIDNGNGYELRFEENQSGTEYKYIDVSVNYDSEREKARGLKIFGRFVNSRNDLAEAIADAALHPGQHPTYSSDSSYSSCDTSSCSGGC